MHDPRSKRIAIFEYDWSMYSFIKDFIMKLVENGYSVDIFFKDWDVMPSYADLDNFKRNENIRFYDFTTKTTSIQVFKRRVNRLLNKIAILFSIPRNDKAKDIIDREILIRSQEIIRKSQYYCLIGIEKKGLIWAGILSALFHYPLIYHNLELYIDDNPEFDKVYHLMNAEKKYHDLAVATIVQDVLRAKVLLKSNQIEKMNVLYFPVSVKGNIIREKSNYLQKKFDIGVDKKILLYFGSLDKTRCTTQMVKMAHDLDNDTVLVVHGWGPKKYLDFLQSIADKKRVIFSFDFLKENEIVNMVSSSHIGICIYDTTNLNDRLVAFSSSKMAYFAQCGIPMIAFDTESFRELVNTNKCIELINSTEEIPQKVTMIFANYDFYQQQSYNAYNKFYNLDVNFSKLIRQLEKIVDGAPASIPN